MVGLALYKKIALGALVLTLVTYEVKQVTYNNNRQISMPSGATSIIEINQYVLSHGRAAVKKYLSNFSPSLANDVIRQMGVGNLTSEILQQQFLVQVQGKWLHVSYMDFILIVLQFGSTGPKCFL